MEMSICVKNILEQLQASDVVRTLLIRHKIKLLVNVKNVYSGCSLLIEDFTAGQLLVIAVRAPLVIEFHEFPLTSAVQGQFKPFPLTFYINQPF